MEQNKDQGGAAVRGEAVAVLDGWKIGNACEGRITVQKHGVGGYAADRDSESVAESILYELACSLRYGAAPVSARAADAPSEPSEPFDTDEWEHTVNDWMNKHGVEIRYTAYRELVDIGNKFAAQFVKSRAADALDSQPTEIVAYLHQVVSGDGEPDQALSFAPDNFPLSGTLGYRSVSHQALVVASSQPTEPDGLPPLPEPIEVGGEGWDFDDFKSEKTFSCEHMWAYARAAIARSQPTDGGVRNGCDLKAVHAFLMGESPLEGVQFGEKHPTKAGAYWWRLNLRAAMVAEPVGATFDREEFIRQVSVSVAEMDRDSPEGQPEMMLVTPDELQNTMRSVFERFDDAAPMVADPAGSKIDWKANAGCLLDEVMQLRQVIAAAAAGIAPMANPAGVAGLTRYDAPAIYPVGGYAPMTTAGDGEYVRFDDVMALAATVKAVPSEALTGAARDVLAERSRQVEAEGWTPEHDDAHNDGSMAQAAACYAYPELVTVLPGLNAWPWAEAWFKVRDARRNYVRAAALLLAEIERIDRAAPLDDKTGGGE